MRAIFRLSLFILVAAFAFGQSSSALPTLPVIDDNACPFEGCSFSKWLVTHDVVIYSSWKDDRKQVSTLHKGDVVLGLTGVHITDEPDKIQVLQAFPELGLRPGDFILRFMYHGEGFSDIWVKGVWHKEYDCTFIQEKDGSGCSRNCAAKVISEGKKAWWVRVRTATGTNGWTLVEDQFDCMDSLSGDPKCDKL